MNDENEARTEETPTPDPRILAALEDLDYPYEINPHTADFHVRYNFEDARTQMVTICSTTDEFMGIELRDEVLARLLALNATRHAEEVAAGTAPGMKAGKKTKPQREKTEEDLL
jgi:hypothetical protein